MKGALDDVFKKMAEAKAARETPAVAPALSPAPATQTPAAGAADTGAEAAGSAPEPPVEAKAAGAVAAGPFTLAKIENPPCEILLEGGKFYAHCTAPTNRQLKKDPGDGPLDPWRCGRCSRPASRPALGYMDAGGTGAEGSRVSLPSPLGWRLEDQVLAEYTNGKVEPAEGGSFEYSLPKGVTVWDIAGKKKIALNALLKEHPSIKSVWGLELGCCGASAVLEPTTFPAVGFSAARTLYILTRF